MSDKVRVYRMDVLVVDHDRLGPDGARQGLENARFPNDCMSPEVIALEEREVEWSDDHPLNQRDGWRAAADALFAPVESSTREAKLAKALVQIVDQIARGSHGPTLMQLLQATSTLREAAPQLDKKLREHIQQINDLVTRAAKA